MEITQYIQTLEYKGNEQDISSDSNKVYRYSQQAFQNNNYQTFQIDKDTYDCDTDLLCVLTQKELTVDQLLDHFEHLQLLVRRDDEYIVQIQNIKQILTQSDTVIDYYKSGEKFIYKIPTIDIITVASPLKQMIIRIDTPKDKDICNIYFEISLKPTYYESQRLIQYRYSGTKSIYSCQYLPNNKKTDIRYSVSTSDRQVRVIFVNGSPEFTQCEHTKYTDCVEIVCNSQKETDFYVYYKYEI